MADILKEFSVWACLLSETIKNNSEKRIMCVATALTRIQAQKRESPGPPRLSSLYVKYCSFQAAANSSTGFLFD